MRKRGSDRDMEDWELLDELRKRQPNSPVTPKQMDMVVKLLQMLYGDKEREASYRREQMERV